MDRVAIQIDWEPLRVTVHPEVKVKDLGPAPDGIHDYKLTAPWLGSPMIWCARGQQDLCAAVRDELAKAAR